MPKRRTAFRKCRLKLSTCRKMWRLCSHLLTRLSTLPMKCRTERRREPVRRTMTLPCPTAPLRPIRCPTVMCPASMALSPAATCPASTALFPAATCPASMALSPAMTCPVSPVPYREMKRMFLIQCPVTTGFLPVPYRETTGLLTAPFRRMTVCPFPEIAFPATTISVF